MSLQNAHPIDIRREQLGSPIVTSLIVALNAELTDGYPEAGANHFRLDAEEVSDDRGAFLVAYREGIPVGCGAIRRLDTETAEIKRMYVVPQARGRGVGRAVLAGLETEAGRLGVGRIVLETGVRQPEAIGLYLTAGFVRTPPFGEYLESSLSVCMAKAVTSTAERTQPPIVTSRLVLTPLVADDAQPLLEYRSLPAVRRFQLFEPRTLEDVRQFIAAGHVDSPVWFQYGIRPRESAQLAGDIGHRRTAEDPRQVELGVTLAPGFQGRGIAGEAVGGLLDHLFGTSTVHRAYVSIDPRNESSRRLFERLGLRQEAHLRKSLWFKGEYVDDVIYAILRSEWERVGA